MRVGVVGHRGYELLPEVLLALRRLGDELSLDLRFEDGLREMSGATASLDDPGALDALLTLGGDGTLLRGARLLDGRQVPILGVNLGRLGFLTTCGGHELEPALRGLAGGRFAAEPRMALRASVRDPNGDERALRLALNDAVLHKGGFARVVRLSMAADGESIASYAADGVVVSTPTGSTAYALSAGGPVIVPTLDSILVAPVSPHALAIRPVLLPPDAVVTIEANDGPEHLLVTIDGQVGTTFAVGETLVVRRAPHPVLIVRFPGATFFSRLRHKLGWGGLAERDE